MSIESARKIENESIKVPLSSTVIIATFTDLNRDPQGGGNYMDVRARNTAVWLTTPGTEPNTHVIIGPDGKESPICVEWTDDGPIFTRKTKEGLEVISTRTRNDVSVVNIPEGETSHVVLRQYPGLREEYTVFQLHTPPNQNLSVDSFRPYIGRHQLVSGMNARGITGIGNSFATDWKAIRITDRSNLPFGRELKATSANK